MKSLDADWLIREAHLHLALSQREWRFSCAVPGSWGVLGGAEALRSQRPLFSCLSA